MQIIRRKFIFKLLRMAFGVGIAVVLVVVTVRSTGSDLLQEWHQAEKPFLVAAAAMFFFLLVLSTIRWQILLRVQEIRLGAMELLRLTLIGLFFNMMMPGAVGGDLVKTAILMRRARDKKPEVITTVFLDRVFGAIGLFTLAIIMALLFIPVLLRIKPELYPVVMKTLAVLTIAGLAAAGLFFLLGLGGKEKHLWLKRILTGWIRKLPDTLERWVGKMTEALAAYRRHKRTVVFALLISVSGHALYSVMLFLVGLGLGERGIGIFRYFVVVPIANAVSAVPLTPGGVGTRDASFAFLFSLLGAPSEKVGAIAVIMTFIILFWALVGGLVFSLSRVPRIRPEALTTKTVEQ